MYACLQLSKYTITQNPTPQKVAGALTCWRAKYSRTCEGGGRGHQRWASGWVRVGSPTAAAQPSQPRVRLFLPCACRSTASCGRLLGGGFQSNIEGRLRPVPIGHIRDVSGGIVVSLPSSCLARSFRCCGGCIFVDPPLVAICVCPILRRIICVRSTWIQSGSILTTPARPQSGQTRPKPGRADSSRADPFCPGFDV
jgi:hypothetical protein